MVSLYTCPLSCPAHEYCIVQGARLIGIMQRDRLCYAFCALGFCAMLLSSTRCCCTDHVSRCAEVCVFILRSRHFRPAMHDLPHAAAVRGCALLSSESVCGLQCLHAHQCVGVRGMSIPCEDLSLRSQICKFVTWFCPVRLSAASKPLGSLSKESIGARLTVVGLSPWCYHQLSSSCLMQGRNHGADHSVHAGFQSTYSIERPVCSEYVTGLGARLVILYPIILKCSH